MFRDIVNGTFPQNLALICVMGSDETGFTDDGKGDGRPRAESSSTVQ